MTDISEIFEIINDANDIRSISEHSRKNPKIYLEHVNPFQKYDDVEFKKIYKFKKETVQNLVEKLRPLLDNRLDNKGRPVTPELQLLSTIRYLCKGNYQSECAHLHNISQATMSRVCAKVSRAVTSLSNEFIVFPTNAQDLSEVKKQFYAIANMPNIVGVIDCIHVKIKKPSENSELYINTNGFYSINVQIVCDAKGKILNIVAQWRGSTHDSWIWDNSNLKTKFESGEINGILVGDNDYSNSQFILTPLLDSATSADYRYNQALIKTKNVIGRLFEQWQKKFHCFFNGMNMSLDTAKACIVTLAILHNIAMDETLNDIRDTIEEYFKEELVINGLNIANENFRQKYINTYFS